MAYAPQFWLLGDPVAHSLSPIFQNAALRHLALPHLYATRHTPPEDLAAAIDAIRNGEALGANVTLPHKRAVVGLLDRVDAVARRAGAVNTIVREDGGLAGYNTDVSGLARALREWWIGPLPRQVQVLGAGGAARGAVLALESLGVREVWVSNRTQSTATALVDDLDTSIRLRVGRHVCDLVIHTTSLGVGAAAGSPDHAAAAGNWRDVDFGGDAYDACYGRAGPTPFLLAAERAGADRRLDGLSMLVHQGADALALWTGRQPPRQVMLRALQCQQA
jgi:shikimate dehydrogenase